MRKLAYAVALAIIMAIVFRAGSFASAQSQPVQGYGGGYVSGYVYGYNMWDELIPLDWVQVNATSDQYGTFSAYTAGGGFYDMFLPTGTFMLSVEEPGFKAYNMSIAVSDGASLNGINFYLERSNVPIPEFPTQIISLMVIIAIAAALIARRAAKRRNPVA